MAYVAPNSIVEFYTNLGLTNNYDDSLYFATTAAKDSYFNTISKLATAQTLSYNREQRGYIRVELPMSTLISASYMRFKNTSFENKWFYAFIKNVEYINNNCTQINFEIDPLMTWMGSFTLNKCFVERQHNETDAVGDNIVEENLDLGDYVYNSISRTNQLGNYTIIIGASVDQNGNNVAGGTMVNNIYSGIVLHQFATVEAANNFINNLTDKAKSDALVACVMCPSKFIIDGSAVTETVTVAKNLYRIDGYQPNNNKLFTYPFNYLVVTNGQGNFATFRYEFFRANADNCTFQLGGIAGLQPEVVLSPIQYKGSPLNVFNYAEQIVLNNFPQCAFNIDQYKAFLAQNSASIGVDAISTVASGAVSTVGNILTGNVMGAVNSGLNLVQQVASKVAYHMDYAKKPTQSNGVTTGGFDASRREKDFWFLKQSITAEYAEIIDNYFDMFGYAQNKCMTPNMNVRPYWTYVKTIGCSLEGNLPADDASTIENIFNNGIRFWKQHSQIGNYNLDNKPVQNNNNNGE